MLAYVCKDENAQFHEGTTWALISSKIERIVCLVNKIFKESILCPSYFLKSLLFQMLFFFASN